MRTVRSIAIALTRAAAAFSISVATAAPVAAADWYKAVTPPDSYAGEFGTRLWFGRARTAKDLFDTTGTVLVSRLDYHDMNVFSAEAYSRLDFNGGWFLKGYAGGGGLFGGKLKDEDFPPAIDPYSATTSEQGTGTLFYGSVDAGFKVVRGGDFHLGVFAGYHFMRDSVVAWGCGQIAANPFVCGGGIPDFIKVITQTNDWHALRVGLEAQVEFDRRWKLAVDAAWLPFARLHGKDAHWLRIGTNPGDFWGPVPEDGDGWGYQFDAFLSYRISDLFSVGFGGRYWHVESKGHTHFEGHVVGFNASPQVVHWKADHFGGFLQASIKLGPSPLIGGDW